MGLAGRWKCTQALFSVELNQSKRNQHTRRIEAASCHVYARSALLVLRANNNFDIRVCGLCCMVQEKHALVIGCCATYAIQKPSFKRPELVAAWVFATPSSCHAAIPQGLYQKAVNMCLQAVSLSINAPSTLTRPIFRPTDTLFFLK